jgi:hypothetical protein
VRIAKLVGILHLYAELGFESLISPLFTSKSEFLVIMLPDQKKIIHKVLVFQIFFVTSPWFFFSLLLNQLMCIIQNFDLFFLWSCLVHYRNISCKRLIFFKDRLIKYKFLCFWHLIFFLLLRNSKFIWESFL